MQDTLLAACVVPNACSNPGALLPRAPFCSFLWFDLPPDSGPVVSLPPAPDVIAVSASQLPLPPPQPSLLTEQQPEMPLAHLCVQQQQQQQQQEQQPPPQQQQPDSSVPVSGSRAGGKRSGGRGRGRGAGAAPATAASQEELLAEKERKEEERRARNRATQARFRERQKARDGGGQRRCQRAGLRAVLACFQRASDGSRRLGGWA